MNNQVTKKYLIDVIHHLKIKYIKNKFKKQ